MYTHKCLKLVARLPTIIAVHYYHGGGRELNLKGTTIVLNKYNKIYDLV